MYPSVQSHAFQGTSPNRSQGTTSFWLWCGVLLTLFVGMACVVRFDDQLGLLPDSCRRGIGDVELAQTKIKPGMTKDEVHSLLGRPHRKGEYGQYGAEWDYYETIFVGSVLRINFGVDDRVTSTEWWVD